MAQARTLSEVLYKKLAIPADAASDLWVQRALIERAAAAAALQNIEAHMLCLQAELDALRRMQDLLDDVRSNTDYDELDLAYAEAEI